MKTMRLGHLELSLSVSSHGSRCYTRRMTLIAQKLLTAEEFWALPEGEGKRELVRGEVVVHSADGLARTLHAGDVLENLEVLPGFSLAVNELFA